MAGIDGTNYSFGSLMVGVYARSLSSNWSRPDKPSNSCERMGDLNEATITQTDRLHPPPPTLPNHGSRLRGVQLNCNVGAGSSQAHT